MKITKNQLRRIIREEKARLISEQKKDLLRDKNKPPVVEGIGNVTDGVGAFMKMLAGTPEPFFEWLRDNPKILKWMKEKGPLARATDIGDGTEGHDRSLESQWATSKESKAAAEKQK